MFRFGESAHTDPEEELLVDDGLLATDSADLHALRTAPVLTSDALAHCGPHVVPQRAVYGRLLAQHASGFPLRTETSKLYINTNAPFSALVCGVQGSGKSHSTSVLLESCLVKDPRIGTLPEPLSALVFHFDTAAGGGLVQPCEAAYLAALDPARAGSARAPPVKVLVLPNSIKNMRKVYAGLPGVSVEPLHFAPEDINGSRLLSMMKLADGQQLPLYMEALMDILRSMEERFSYSAFRAELQNQKFSPAQKSMLNLRLALLDSCLAGGSAQNSVRRHFVQGQLTIIDLSSPFMDPTSACGFFDLILGLFMETDCASGKIVVLDEAHKYLSESSSRLTESLLTVIRQQRHLATRVVVSTQEPTVVPAKFIDLCSFVIAHRFSSPVWIKTLAGHVSTESSDADDLFAKIVALRTGEGIMFAPSGLARKEGVAGEGAVAPLGKGYVVVKSRLRITRDGGHSLLAVKGESAPPLVHENSRAADVSGIETQLASLALNPPKVAPTTASTSVPKPLVQLVSSSAAASSTKKVHAPSASTSSDSTTSSAISAFSASTYSASSASQPLDRLPSHVTAETRGHIEKLLAWLDQEKKAGRTGPWTARQTLLGMNIKSYELKAAAKTAMFETAQKAGLVKTWVDGAGTRSVQPV